ncbi:hypothetical protein GBA52_006061 [Prunus armeniaca]|nr:hypothetical protein GBA52_006061 [Prunus armeniaca]
MEDWIGLDLLRTLLDCEVSGDQRRPCELFGTDFDYCFDNWYLMISSFSMLQMGKCKGCGKLGRMMPRGGSVSAYQFSLLLSPVVSVWDCIVRKMRYSYRPEWV